MTPTPHPGQLLWTKAVQAEKPAWKQAQFRPGIRAVFSFAQRFSVPRIQTAISAPSVHNLLTLTTTGSGAAEFVSCDLENADDFEEHAETRARQNTIVANLTFYNKLSLVNVQALLGSFHVNVSAFDGDDALIPLDSSNAHCNPNSSVTMSKHLSADVHTVAFNVVFAMPIQHGVIPGTFFIPFTASIMLQLGGAPLSSVRPVAPSDPTLPFPIIRTCGFGEVSPNGKWFCDPPHANWSNWCLRFQRAQGHPGVEFPHHGRPVFLADSSQIWCMSTSTDSKIVICSVPDCTPVLTIPEGGLPPIKAGQNLVATTLGGLAFAHPSGFMVLEATKADNGQMQLVHSKTIHLGGHSDWCIRTSRPAQERWRNQVLVSEYPRRLICLGCVSASTSEACGFKISFGLMYIAPFDGFSSSGSLVQMSATWRVLPFATLFDVSIPIVDRRRCTFVPDDMFVFRGSAKFSRE